MLYQLSYRGRQRPGIVAPRFAEGSAARSAKDRSSRGSDRHDRHRGCRSPGAGRACGGCAERQGRRAPGRATRARLLRGRGRRRVRPTHAGCRDPIPEASPDPGDREGRSRDALPAREARPAAPRAAPARAGQHRLGRRLARVPAATLRPAREPDRRAFRRRDDLRAAEVPASPQPCGGRARRYQDVPRPRARPRSPHACAG